MSVCNVSGFTCDRFEYVRTMQEAVKNGAKEFVGSSGGNAGMAMAVAAKQLKKKLTIFIPTSTLPFMIEKLKVSKIYLEIYSIHDKLRLLARNKLIFLKSD